MVAELQPPSLWSLLTLLPPFTALREEHLTGNSNLIQFTVAGKDHFKTNYKIDVNFNGMEITSKVKKSLFDEVKAALR